MHKLLIWFHHKGSVCICLFWLIIIHFFDPSLIKKVQSVNHQKEERRQFIPNLFLVFFVLFYHSQKCWWNPNSFRVVWSKKGQKNLGMSDILGITIAIPYIFMNCKIIWVFLSKEVTTYNWPRFFYHFGFSVLDSRLLCIWLLQLLGMKIQYVQYFFS